MFFMPFNILGMWFRGLLSIAILAGGIYLLYRWYDDSHVVERTPVPVATDRVRADDLPPGEDAAQRPPPSPFRAAASSGSIPAGTRRRSSCPPHWPCWSGRPVDAWSGTGSRCSRSGRAHNPPSSPDVVQTRVGSGKPESKRSRKQKARRQKQVARVQIVPEADEDPSGERTGEVHMIRRPDGSELRVECYGPPDAPPVVWTHGWGANCTEWYYQKRYLTERFRLIVWDEPGLGLSKKPDNNDYRLENLAADLDAVLAFAGDRPAVLVGHSIGGMITLTYCKDYPQALGTRVAGLVLVHTTYTNPVRTTQMAGLYTAIEKPVLIPLMYLTIGLWPLVWLMNWMSYFNGSAHRSTHKSSFSGNETRGQLDFAARFMPHARPDVLARGMLGMIAYDATEALPRINVPTLVVVGDKDTTTTPRPESSSPSMSPEPGSSRSPLPSTWG